MKSINKRSLSDEYKARVPALNRLREEAEYIINTSLQREKIEIHRIEGRVKNLESFLKKAEKDEHKAAPLDTIQDQCGTRIVCLFLGQIDEIASLIRKEFSVLSEDNKIEGVDEHSFGYMAFHFICKLSSSCSGPRYDDIKILPFEIQLRTLSMDLWATISHHVQYKKTLDVPKDMQKDFNALSGLLYVADTHFEMFYHKAANAQKEISHSVGSPDWETVDLNVDTLREFLIKKYPDREHGNASDYSQLLSELVNLGYKTLGELDASLAKTKKAVLANEKKYPPTEEDNRTPSKYVDIGIVRVSLRFIHKEFLNQYTFKEQITEFMHLVD